MAQTAVEWLQIQLKNGVDFNPLDPLSYPKAVDNLFEQAKQMNKEQSKQDYEAGFFDGIMDDGLFDGTVDDVKDRLYKNAEQYYNETYGK